MIKTELVKVSDGSQIWGESYQRKLSEILPIQEEIAQRIIQRLRVRLTGEQQKRFAKRQTESAEAYHLYLNGRYHWNKRSPDGLRNSLEFFHKAIQKDPTYALAYAGLADGYAGLGNYNILPTKEAYLKSRAAAKKALEIDDQLGEAHISLAWIHMYYWEWPEAEDEFRRGIELNPGYATAYHWYANYLAVVGKQDQALSSIQKALELDPLSLIINETAGLHLYLARRYDEAIEQLKKALELDSDFILAHEALGEVYIQKGMYLQAVHEFEKTINLSGGLLEYRALLAYAYAASGNRSEALRILEILNQERIKENLSAYYLALIHTALGNKEEAVKWLKLLYDEHSQYILFVRVDPAFDSLRTDPRLQNLWKWMGLAG